MTTPDDEVVGSRITDALRRRHRARPAGLGRLPDRRTRLGHQADRTGVYWFGVHALGLSDSVPDDAVADGRARTFLPFVPPRFDATPLAVSVVVPLTRSVRYAADGSVAGPAGLDRRPRRRPPRPAAQPGRRQPRPGDLAGRPRAGRRGRPPGRGQPARAASGPSATGDGEPTEEPTAERRAAGRHRERPGRGAVARAARHRPGRRRGADAALRRRRRRRHARPRPGAPRPLARPAQRRPEALDVDTRPVLAPPNGYLDPAGVHAADPGSRVLVTDRMLGADPPAVADADGHRLLTTSYGVTQGSPGPGPSLTAVGIRQRLLAEAALRAVRSDREPLVAVLPSGWDLDDAGVFWDGLDAPWIDLRRCPAPRRRPPRSTSRPTTSTTPSSRPAASSGR